MSFETYIDDLQIPEHWTNTSYHHDELPSYQVNGFHIWMDSHHLQERVMNSARIMGTNHDLLEWYWRREDLSEGFDLSKVEHTLAPRFIVQTSDRYNCHNSDWTNFHDSLHTNNFQEVIDFVHGKHLEAMFPDFDNVSLYNAIIAKMEPDGFTHGGVEGEKCPSLIRFNEEDESYYEITVNMKDRSKLEKDRKGQVINDWEVVVGYFDKDQDPVEAKFLDYGAEHLDAYTDADVLKATYVKKFFNQLNKEYL
jgi:hypothetical protein